MTLVERLRYKISPLEDKKFTAELIPRIQEVDLTPYLRQYKGTECVVLSPGDAWELFFPDRKANLHEYTVLGRSLQALLWERSYLRGNLVFTKTMYEVNEDGY